MYVTGYGLNDRNSISGNCGVFIFITSKLALSLPRNTTQWVP
jgi:hypothetical protein